MCTIPPHGIFLHSLNKKGYNTFMKSKESLAIKGKVRIITTDSITGKVKRKTRWQKNLIMLGTNTGKDLILDRLNSSNTYSLNITHLDIGTSSTTPVITDTQLGAAVSRTAKAGGTIASNVLTLRFFFASVDLANGTYREVGTFVDGTSSVNTGQIFNHILFSSAYVKGTNEDTTIEVVFTIT